MKMFLLLWALPVGFLGAWYFLSLNDMHFGMTFFSREMHDLVFGIYGNLLGIDPASIPPLLLRAIVVDSLIVLAILAFRRRRKIAAFVRERRAAYSSANSLSLERRPDSLSSAP